MTILALKDVSLDLGGKRILNRVSIAFRGGHIHALIGPNGAGKSTLANVVMGLSGYDGFEGDVLFEGESLRGLSVNERAKRGITLAWQEPARFEGIAVDAFIRAAAKDKSDSRVRQVLEQVGLEPDKYTDRAVDRTLSGGERKRIELASILAMEPKLVLMDEPDSGIDVEALERIFEALKIFKGRGATVITITHSVAVLRQADYAYLLCCGQLVNEGPIDQIGHYFQRRCVPCDNISPETVATEGLHAGQ